MYVDRAPAVFAESAHERTSSNYTFIPTERVLTGLMQAGFVPVEARQTRARYGYPMPDTWFGCDAGSRRCN